MIVTLDHQRLADPFSAEDTLQTLIDRVRDLHLKDRIIVSVAVDGRVLGDSELNTSLQQPVAPAAQVDLESSQPAAVAAATLRGLATEFGAAGPRLADIADRLNSPDIAAAIRDVGRFMSLWQTCYRALPQCGRLCGRDLLDTEYEGQPLKDRLNELVEKLTDLRAALEARDTVMLADLVRYELAPLAQTWHGILNHLADRIEPPA
jgi:hypothetical protein